MKLIVKDVTEKEFGNAPDLTIEELHEWLKVLQDKIPTNMTKPADWTLENKRTYVQYNYLTNYLGERIKQEFKDAHGF